MRQVVIYLQTKGCQRGSLVFAFAIGWLVGLLTLTTGRDLLFDRGSYLVSPGSQFTSAVYGALRDGWVVTRVEFIGENLGIQIERFKFRGR